MKRFRSSSGIQWGTSCLTLPVDAVKTIEMSVNTRASQVITPTVNSNRIMAFVLTNWITEQKNKPIRRLAYNYMNNIIFRRSILTVMELLPAVIRRFTSNRHVVRVTFHYSCTGNLNELGFLQALNVRCATVAHSSLQASHHLV